MRVARMFFLMFFLCSTVAVVGQRGGSAEPPTGTTKEPVKIVQDDGAVVTLQAQKAGLAAHSRCISREVAYGGTPTESCDCR
jgi:hypothetical protein